MFGLAGCPNCATYTPHNASDVRCDGCARHFYEHHIAHYQAKGPYRGQRLCADCIVEMPGASNAVTPYPPFDPYEEMRKQNQE